MIQGLWGGLRIIYDMNALETTQERLFPASKHRSKRIHKKLVKRHGGEFRRVPAMFQMGDKLFVHPAHRERLETAIRQAT